MRTLAPRDIPVSHSVVLGGALLIAGELGIPGPTRDILISYPCLGGGGEIPDPIV